MSKICDLCKTENDDDSQFCDKCGNPLVEMLEEKEEASDESKPESKKIKSADYKLLAIPAALIIILGIILFVSNMQKTAREKAVKEVVSNYMEALKSENYAKALETALGTPLSADYEESFKSFMMQLIPPMPINSTFNQTLADLVKIGEAIEHFRHTNRVYPENLNRLTPIYLESIPSVSGEWAYVYDSRADNYTVYVKGNAFVSLGLPEDKPSYSRTDKLQVPDRKIVYGEWKVKDYQIIDVTCIGKEQARIKVVENATFGSQPHSQEVYYGAVFRDGQWRLNPDTTGINLFTLTNAYTQMGYMAETTIAPPEGATEEEAAQVKTEPAYPPMSLGMTLLTFSKIAADPNNLTVRTQYQYNRCIESLNRMGSALGRYAGRHNGQFPRHLVWLVPNYLESIPLNLAAGQDTFSSGYSVSDNVDVFTISTQGNHFKSLGVEEGYPMFTSKYRLLQKSADIPPEPVMPIVPDEPEDEDTDEDGDHDPDREPEDGEIDVIVTPDGEEEENGESPDKPDKKEDDKVSEEDDKDKKEVVKPEEKDPAGKPSNGTVTRPKNGSADENNGSAAAKEAELKKDGQDEETAPEKESESNKKNNAPPKD